MTTTTLLFGVKCTENSDIQYIRAGKKPRQLPFFFFCTALAAENELMMMTMMKDAVMFAPFLAQLYI
jgi:hypothetical protein